MNTTWRGLVVAVIVLLFLGCLEIAANQLLVDRPSPAVPTPPAAPNRGNDEAPEGQTFLTTRGDLLGLDLGPIEDR